jgi:hypothetical protein
VISPPTTSFVTAKKKFFLNFFFNYLQMILCSVPWVEIRPSDAISLARDSVLQVKQNKISWDKFLQIPANFEIISQQIRDWNIPY